MQDLEEIYRHAVAVGRKYVLTQPITDRLLTIHGYTNPPEEPNYFIFSLPEDEIENLLDTLGKFIGPMTAEHRKVSQDLDTSKSVWEAGLVEGLGVGLEERLETILDSRDRIKQSLEQHLERLANIDAAVTASYIGDAQLEELEAEGYSIDESVSPISFGYDEEGNLLASNTSPIVDSFWVDILRLPKRGYVYIWGEIPEYEENFFSIITDELENQGYEETSIDYTVDEELEIQLSFVKDAVVKDLSVDPDLVDAVSRYVFGDVDYAYRRTTGEASIWAHPIELD